MIKSIENTGAIVSLAVSAALVSGISVLHDTAFALAVFFNVVGWLGMLLVPNMSQEAIDAKPRPWIKWPVAFAYWLALAYTGHAYLLASSLVCAMLHSFLTKQREDELKAESAK